MSINKKCESGYADLISDAIATTERALEIIRGYMDEDEIRK